MRKIIDSSETNMYQEGRESGYISGYEDGLNTKIEQLSLHSTEAITLFFDTEKNTYEEIKNIFYLVKEKFPSNKVIALPNTTSLESCSKDVLENIISMILEVIEKL